MPIDFSAVLYELVKKIVFSAISKRVTYGAEKFLTKRKIESRIEDSIAQVVEQLLPFFENERISESKRHILIDTCDRELTELLANPEDVFAASLDGQKVFDRRYASGRLPEAIREEGLQDLYALVFPQVANLVCAYPPAVEQWKIEGFRDGFRRLDEIAVSLSSVANKLDSLTSKDADAADVLVVRVRQSLAQRVEFQLDLTGLRGDRPDAVPLEKCFVVPQLRRTVEEPRSKRKREENVATETEIGNAFTAGGVRGLVVGAPGSGKSTWSRWLQRLQLTSRGLRLAVLVRLRDLVKTDNLPSHQEIVREAAGTHLREEVGSGTVREWCSSGTMTFILDGFDEIPPNKRDSLLSWITELDVAVGNAGLILTSRPLTTPHLENLAKPWLRWELLPFDEPRVVNYISRWYAHAPLLADKSQSVDAGYLAQRWLQDSVLQPLVGTPLMLATLLMVHHMDGELPRGRAKLYERYIDGMLGLGDSRWGVPSAVELTLDLKKKILTRLALHLHLAEIEQMGDSEMQQLLARILPELGCMHPAGVVLNHLRERTGLVIGPGTWGFVHKSVGEFLVAAAIRDGDQVDQTGQKVDRLRLFRERHNDRWNTVLFFWAGLTAPGDLQSFIEQVAAEPEDAGFLLAMSLIYDQLQPHRLTEPWRSDQLLRLLTKGLTKSASQTTFICGPVPRNIEMEVSAPDSPLRTLEWIPLFKGLWECLKASTITWRQASSCHESLRFVVWIHFTTKPRTADDLRTALSTESRPRPLPNEWMMFPFASGIRLAAARTEGVPLHQFVEILSETFPEHAGKVVFFLLGGLEDLIEHGRLRRQTQQSRTLQSLLQAVKDSRGREVDEKWLQLTREYSDFRRPEPFDLLDTLLTKLGQAVQEEPVSGEGLIADVRALVTDLRTKRDASLTEPPQMP